jgi:recombination protein RecR
MSQGIIEPLIDELTKLPGIGRKSAQRLTFFILSMQKDDALAIAQAIINIKEKARFCSKCFNITDEELCNICREQTRNRKLICVVEEPSDIVVIEKIKIYKGLYHVLLGALSPIDGITPDKLKIKELNERVKTEGTEEVIIATNPNTKGETTAQYITKLLRPSDIKISRIAYGLPIGGDIEFADEVTLTKSLEGRRLL